MISRVILRLLILCWVIGSSAAYAANAAFSLYTRHLTLSQRGQVYAVTLSNPPVDIVGRVQRVYWRYQFNITPPTALKLTLCHQSFCLPLTAGQGYSQAFAGRDVQGEWRLWVNIVGRGMMSPALQLTQGIVTVNYQQKKRASQ